MRPSLITTLGPPRRRSEPRARRGGGCRRGKPARAACTRARPPVSDRAPPSRRRGSGPRRAARRQARRLEQLPRLERAAVEVALDARLGITRLRPLQGLAASERQRCPGEEADRLVVARVGELGERPREEVVAGGAGGCGAVAGPGG